MRFTTYQRRYKISKEFNCKNIIENRLKIRMSSSNELSVIKNNAAQLLMYGLRYMPLRKVEGCGGWRGSKTGEGRNKGI